VEKTQKPASKAKTHGTRRFRLKLQHKNQVEDKPIDMFMLTYTLLRPNVNIFNKDTYNRRLKSLDQFFAKQNFTFQFEANWA